MLEIQFPFPHRYEIEEIPEFPSTGSFPEPVFYFPKPKERPEHDGLWLKFHDADGHSWIGIFAFGDYSLTRVISSPDPNRVCIISKGNAYAVMANQPQTWERVPVLPVLDVRTVRQHGLLVFSDFTGLAAYGSRGLVWQSPRLCWDRLKILNVTDNTIEGTGYDPTHAAHGSDQMNFAVDLRTGRSLPSSPHQVM